MIRYQRPASSEKKMVRDINDVDFRDPSPTIADLLQGCGY